MLEQISEKGIYSVQLKWPQTITDAENALQVEIVFNNASAPMPTNTTIPQREGNATGSGTEAGLTVPGILGGEPMQVESYDMALFTPDGRKLWEKLDQPGQGGRATQRIDLDGNYTGPVTINISDIRPGGGADETSNATDMTDSVSFTATIVPEFPIAISTACYWHYSHYCGSERQAAGLYKINLKWIKIAYSQFFVYERYYFMGQGHWQEG